jgi:membrane protease YdiL (CAAX protease family)
MVWMLLAFSATWGGASLGMLTVNQTLLYLHPHVFHGTWNWEGKIQATVGTLLMGELSGIPARERGWVGPSRKGWEMPVLGVTVGVSSWSLVSGYVFSRPEDRFDRETWAFEATLPGLEEELFWRGLFPAALDRMMSPADSFRVAGAPITRGDLVASLLFYLVHVLPQAWMVGWKQALKSTWDVLPATLALVYVRRRSGSVVPGILLHNLMNTLPAVGVALRW